MTLVQLVTFGADKIGAVELHHHSIQRMLMARVGLVMFPPWCITPIMAMVSDHWSLFLGRMIETKGLHIIPPGMQLKSIWNCTLKTPPTLGI